MSRRVQITVIVDDGKGHTRVESQTLLLDPPLPLAVGRIIADTAKIVGEKAWFGQQLPTPTREGGRG